MPHNPAQPSHSCADCGAHVGSHPFQWWTDEQTWQPMCAGCYAYHSDLELEKQNAVTLAQVICAMWWAIYAHAEGRAV